MNYVFCIAFVISILVGIAIGAAVVLYIKRRTFDHMGTLYINPEEEKMYFEMDIDFEKMSKVPYGRIKVKTWTSAK